MIQRIHLNVSLDQHMFRSEATQPLLFFLKEKHVFLIESLLLFHIFPVLFST